MPIASPSNQQQHQVSELMNKRRLPASLLAVLGAGTLVTLGLVAFQSRESGPVEEPVVNASLPQAPPLEWVKKSGAEVTGPVTAGDVYRQQQGIPATPPAQSNEWLVANTKAALEQSVQRIKQDAADAEALRVAEAQQAERLVEQAEAERIAAEQARPAQLANAQALRDSAASGGDPNGLAYFETSGTRGPANLTVCNESSYRIKVGVVRSNRAYLGLWGTAWIADGFHSLSSGCRRFSFGVGKDLANGYISIFQQGSDGRWRSLSYDNPEPNNAMKATLATHSRWICWPQTATDADPSIDCPDSSHNVLFGLGFGTSGHVVGFTITVTDDGLTQHVRQY